MLVGHAGRPFVAIGSRVRVPSPLLRALVASAEHVALAGAHLGEHLLGVLRGARRPSSAVFSCDQRFAHRARLVERSRPGTQEGGKRVGVAVVLISPGLARSMKSCRCGPAGSSRCRRTGCSPVGDVADDLVERAVVAQRELAASTSRPRRSRRGWCGCRRRSGNAQGEGLAAHVGGLARGHDDARVGHGEAQDGDDLAEVDVADGCGGLLAMSEPMAGSRRGTLIVCGPTPKRARAGGCAAAWRAARSASRRGRRARRCRRRRCRPPWRGPWRSRASRSRASCRRRGPPCRSRGGRSPGTAGRCRCRAP